jgi:hypothetical protein
MEKQKKKALNNNFVASTKALENQEARVNKTNKKINKQSAHLDWINGYYMR